MRVNSNSSDSEKLRALADALDKHDKLKGILDDEVQKDLRRIADKLEKGPK